jgi:hypothetical protein
MTADPGDTKAPPDACKVLWAERDGLVSRSRDVCEDGVSCLVLAPGERAYKFEPLGGTDVFRMHIDPTCTAVCP